MHAAGPSPHHYQHLHSRSIAFLVLCFRALAFPPPSTRPLTVHLSGNMLSTTSGSKLASSSSCMRRSRTLGSKVPRKRTALLVQSKRATAQALAVLGSGGDGPTGGSGNGGGGRPYEPCCGFSSGGDGEPGRAGFSWRVSPQGAAVALLGLGLLGASQASPAWAAATITTDTTIAASPVSLDSAAASAAVPCLTASEEEDATPVFRTLPDNYVALDEEEKELVCPKQFRVREWVFVH